MRVDEVTSFLEPCAVGSFDDISPAFTLCNTPAMAAISFRASIAFAEFCGSKTPPCPPF
jgi:hypothetical protein